MISCWVPRRDAKEIRPFSLSGMMVSDLIPDIWFSKRPDIQSKMHLSLNSGQKLHNSVGTEKRRSAVVWCEEKYKFSNSVKMYFLVCRFAIGSENILKFLNVFQRINWNKRKCIFNFFIIENVHV